MNKNGIGVIGLIFAIAVTAMVVGGGMYLYQQQKQIETLKDQQVLNSPVPASGQSDTVSAAPIATPTTEAGKKVVLGSITGTLGYPSEKLPSNMKVCAQNIDTIEEVCTSEKDGTMYSLDVPEGAYYVYANVPPDTYKAYYDEFVTCGLNASCPSHTKIKVDVKAGLVTKNINPQDWYNQ